MKKKEMLVDSAGQRSKWDMVFKSYIFIKVRTLSSTCVWKVIFPYEWNLWI